MPDTHADAGRSDASSEVTAGPAESRAASLAALAVIVVAAIAWRLACFGGYQGHDDRNYISYAYSYATRGVVPLDDATTWLGRIGFWVPLSLGLKLFGVSEANLALYPMLCSIGSVVVTFCLARMYFDGRIALIAAALLAVFPLDVIFSTCAYADLPVSFYTGAMLLFFVRAERGNAWYDWLGVGLAAGIAYLHKETALAFAVPLGVYVVMRRLWRPGLALVVLGAVFVFCCECGFWSATSGDPLQRFHLASEHQARLPAGPVNLKSWIPRPAKVHRYDNYFIEPVIMFATEQEFGLFYWMAWPAVLFLWRRKDQSTQLWRVVLVVLGGMLCYFPFNFPHITLGRDPRHYTLLTIPAVILLASMIRYMKRSHFMAAAAALVVSSLICVGIDGSRMTMANERALLAWKDQHPGTEIWVDPLVGVNLFFVSNFKNDDQVGVLERAEMASSHAVANLKVLRPDIRTVASLDEAKAGIVVTRDSPERREQDARTLQDAGWKPTEKIAVVRPSAAWLLKMFPQGARFIKRLTPSAGAGLQLWEKSQPDA